MVFLKAAGIGGSILAILALVIDLLKTLIVFDRLPHGGHQDPCSTGVYRRYRRGRVHDRSGLERGPKNRD